MTLAETPPRRSFLARALRDADWLTADRARAYALIWLVMSIGIAAVWVALSHGGLDRLGKPLGTDFASFWTASQLAMSSHPALAYDPVAHHAAQTRLFGKDVGDYAFFYPPMFLWLCLPLASMPYLASLAVWLGATGLAYAQVVRAWLGRAAGWLPILAFPAVLTNVGHGQNGFLSAALFGGGLLLLDRRPFLAGVVLGCLVYKPHLGVLIPVALLAAWRWRAIAGAAFSVILLAGQSLLVFGAVTWRAFLAVSPLARAALEQGLVGNEKMQSLFAAVRLLHGSLPLAYGAQALVALGAAGALIALQRRAFRGPAEGPALVAAALLASPFLLDYDLILLAIPLAWVLRQGLATGFRPWEKIILAAGFILPAVSRSLAALIHLPTGPFVIGAVLWIVLRRGWDLKVASEPAATPPALAIQG
ncbi:MAG: glycosyltransferase family 87 protein [Caulobacteraceae bacterium]|nr:glycosyltransferase family 87 protein [Caulobacteraceae bacterium]